MKTGVTPDKKLNEEWQNFDNDLKKMAVIGAGILAVGLTLVLGTQVILFCAGIAGAAAYLYNPKQAEEWFNSHQATLLGGTLVYLYTGNVIGLVVGAWLGHFLSEKTSQAADRATQVAHAMNPITMPARAFRGTVNYLYSWFPQSQKESAQIQTLENANASSPSADKSPESNEVSVNPVAVAGKMVSESLSALSKFLSTAAAIPTKSDDAITVREQSLEPRPQALRLSDKDARKDSHPARPSSDDDVAPKPTARKHRDKDSAWEQFRRYPIGIM